MDVKHKTTPRGTKEGYSIEWGLASWNGTGKSVRNRYATATGGFSPRSSSEMPIEDLEHLVVESAGGDWIPVEQIPQMIGALTASLARHMAGLSKDPWNTEATTPQE